MLRPRVQVRLEEHEHAALAELAHRRNRRGDLGRMMRVVVVDEHAARLAAKLEPAPGAAKLGKRRRRFGARDARELERGQRRRGVQAVVLAADRKLEVDGLELLAPDDVRHLFRPLVEQPLDVGARRKLRVMVEVDVQDDRDLRAQGRDRPVRLVAFDDEPARASTGVPAELRNLAADRERRIATEPLERERDHPAGRRLAVRARDDDRVAKRDELGEELRA
jgi:hypothetical protein